MLPVDRPSRAGTGNHKQGGTEAHLERWMRVGSSRLLQAMKGKAPTQKKRCAWKRVEDKTGPSQRLFRANLWLRKRGGTSAGLRQCAS